MIFVGSGGLFLIAVTLKDLAGDSAGHAKYRRWRFRSSLSVAGSGYSHGIPARPCGRRGAARGCHIRRGVGLDPHPGGRAVAAIRGLPVSVRFLGQGSLYAPLMANISKWYDRRRGMAVGIVASGQSLSGIVCRRSSPQPSPRSDGATVLSGLASLRGSSCCPCA